MLSILTHLAFAATILQAADYHAEPESDLQAMAWKLQPGDRLVLAAGVYLKPLFLGKSGDADRPIVLTALPGAAVIFDGSALLPGGYEQSMVSVGGNYVTVANLEIRRSPGWGINAWGKHHVTIRHNTVVDSCLGGIQASFSDLSTVHHVLIEGNNLSGNARSNAALTATGGWPASLGVGGTDSVIKGNKVEEGYGEGITAGGSRLVIEGNTVRDHFSACIYLDNATGFRVERNFCLQSRRAPFYSAGASPGYLTAGRSISTGIQIATEKSFHGVQNPSAGNRILNNLVVGAKAAFYYGSYQQGGGLKDTMIAFNTFVDAEVELIHIDDSPIHADNKFVSNMLLQSNGRPLARLPKDLRQFRFECNLIIGDQALPGIRNISADPKLAGGLPNEVRSYAPSASSVAAAKACPVDGITDDFHMQRRPPQPTIGAFEFLRD